MDFYVSSLQEKSVCEAVNEEAYRYIIEYRSDAQRNIRVQGASRIRKGRPVILVGLDELSTVLSFGPCQVRYVKFLQ